jgi:REP element-mobilizing transposase RayT
MPPCGRRTGGSACPYQDNDFYRRRLPHWQPEGASLFVTWRLFGSLPRSFRFSGDKTPDEQFLETDRFLDSAKVGPLWLKDPQIANLIVESLRHGAEELKQYELHAFVVMVNHVHVLLRPFVEVAKITRGVKGTTACRANRIRGRTGLPFWQAESFDHWLRKFEFERIASYIELNPVKAGFVAREEDWRWSSAHPDHASMIVGR